MKQAKHIKRGFKRFSQTGPYLFCKELDVLISRGLGPAISVREKCLDGRNMVGKAYGVLK